MARHHAGRPGRPPIEAAHSHAHTDAPPASTRTRRLMLALLAPCVLAVAIGVVLLMHAGDLPDSVVDSGTPVRGTVTSAELGPCLEEPQAEPPAESPGQPAGPDCVALTIELTDGPAAGETIRKVEPVGPGQPSYAAGDPLVLAFGGGDDAADPMLYHIRDFQRGTPLLLLAGLFAVAVLILGRWQGLRALGGLGLTFVVLVLFILPAILNGENPLLVGIVGAGLIMFVTLYLAHGFTVRTSVAVLGTMVSLLLIGLISVVFAGLSRLTGLDSDAADLITSLGHDIDTRGLLLAGVVIGALGVLDDVTVTQASAVWELRRANPSLSCAELYTAGLRIGRDHVAAAVNTLVLAYAGAALPVLLYSAIADVGLGTILGSQDIAQEILRTLAGSIGIVAAVPVTTALAAVIARNEDMTGTTRRAGKGY